MVVPAIGEIVLVPFPFSDLSDSKIRPAVCLADAGRGDFILCQITSRAFGDPFAVPIGLDEVENCGLRMVSYARPGKLFTAERNLFQKSLGMLTIPAFNRILTGVIGRFQLKVAANSNGSITSA